MDLNPRRDYDAGRLESATGEARVPNQPHHGDAASQAQHAADVEREEKREAEAAGGLRGLIARLMRTLRR